MEVVKTIKLKIYPDDHGWLDGAAIEVNRVFSYCDDVSQKQHDYCRAGSPRKPPAGFDLCSLTPDMRNFASTSRRIRFSASASNMPRSERLPASHGSGGAHRGVPTGPLGGSRSRG